MNILLTLDYELFFGPRTGSPEASILVPTNALQKLANAKHVVLVFFVDVAYIAALRREMRKFAQLRKDHDLLCRNVEQLAREGHEIQLHIHPHWEDCRWNGDSWQMDTRRYRLHDFEPHEISRLVHSYVNVLKELAGADHAFAYRAGGWVIQPFVKLRDAMLAAGVRIDSTVFPGGTANDDARFFDFRAAPRFGHWRFEIDPCQPHPGGSFLEVPISSVSVAPSYFWRFAMHRTLESASSKAFGDGHAIGAGRFDMLKRLLTRTSTVVSMDGYKSTLLESGHQQYAAADAAEYVVMGHPKLLSRFSLERLERFLTAPRTSHVVGYRHYLAQLE